MGWHSSSHHYNTTTLHHYNTTTLKHSTIPPFHHYNTTTLRHYNTPPFQNYNTKTFHKNSTATLYHFNTTALYQNRTTTLQHSSTTTLTTTHCQHEPTRSNYKRFPNQSRGTRYNLDWVSNFTLKHAFRVLFFQSNNWTALGSVGQSE